MIKSGNTYIIEHSELMQMISYVVKETIEQVKTDPVTSNEDMCAEDVMQDLGIKRTALYRISKSKHPIPFVGSPKKRLIKRQDLENWKQKYWGKYA